MSDWVSERASQEVSHSLSHPLLSRQCNNLQPASKHHSSCTKQMKGTMPSRPGRLLQHEQTFCFAAFFLALMLASFSASVFAIATLSWCSCCAFFACKLPLCYSDCRIHLEMQHWLHQQHPRGSQKRKYCIHCLLCIMTKLPGRHKHKPTCCQHAASAGFESVPQHCNNVAPHTNSTVTASARMVLLQGRKLSWGDTLKWHFNAEHE